MCRSYLIRCVLIGALCIGISVSDMGQTVIFTDSGKSYNDTNGTTLDNYNIDISNCSKVGFSMNFGFSLPWAGDNNMDSPSECNIGGTCAGNPNNPSGGGCNMCWDFLWAQFFIDGSPVFSELVGTDAYAVQNGVISLSQTSCLNATTATLSVNTQTWAADETAFFNNISIVCWEKETPAIFTQDPCAGDPLTLIEIGATAPTAWNWSGPAGRYSGNPWVILNSDPNLHDGTYRVTVTDAAGCTSTSSVQVNVDQFFAEMVPDGATEVCLNNCTSVRVATDRMSGSYDYDIDFGGFSGSDDFATAEQIINVCYNGSGPDPTYNSGTNTIHIPTSYSANSIDLELTSIQDNSGMMCNGDIIGLPLTIDLVAGVMANTPSYYSLCEESVGSMTATFDLTTKDNEVDTLGTANVVWHFDMFGVMQIPDPTALVTGSTTVYAQLQKGACASNLVPLDLIVTPGEAGNVLFMPLNGSPVCVTDTSGTSVMLEMVVPNGSIEYIVDLDYIIDGNMTSTSISSFNDPIITFFNVYDSLDIVITDVTVTGSCPFSGTFSDTTVYIRLAPIITAVDTIRACGLYVLDSIDIINGTGSEAYYDQPDGMGPIFIPGDTITTDTILYAYDDNGGCFDESEVVIEVTPGAVIDFVADTIACGFLELEALTGMGLTSGIGYFTQPMGNGLRFEAGDTLFNSLHLFPYDSVAACVNVQDTFKVTIIPFVDMSGINNFSACQMWVVDSLGLLVDSLLYYTIPTLDTIRLGDTIMSDMLLGIEAGMDSCFTYKAITINISSEVMAGQGRTRDICLNTTDSVNLFTVLDIMTPYTPGGEWRDINGYGVSIDSAGMMDVTSLLPDTYEFQYFVSDSVCGQDSTIATINLFEELNAGIDTSLILCTGMADLLSLIGGDPGGAFTINPAPSVTVDFSDPTNVNFAGIDIGIYNIEYEIGSSVCNTDIATIVLDVRGTADAGTGRPVDICAMSTDSIILSSQIMGPSDPGGIWESATDPGVIISSTNSISVTGLNSGIYEFDYIVDIPMCGQDTATVEVNVIALPDAGRDSLIMTCGDVFDLRNYHLGNSGGYYEINPAVGVDFSNPISVDFNGLPVGNYQVSYIDSAGLCGADTSILDLMILAFPDAGTGTVGNACTGVPDSVDLTTLLMPPFDMGGRWESFTDPTLQISSTSNVLMGSSTPGTYEFNYIVDLPICGSDTATVMIDVFRSPDAGRDSLITTCGDILDLQSIHGGDLGGSYGILPSVGLDFSDPTAVDVNGLAPGLYEIFYEVTDPVCNTDIATIQLDILAFPNAGTGTVGNACTGVPDSTDLTSLLMPPFDIGGRWESFTDPGIQISSTSNVMIGNSTPGTYEFNYIVDLPICGSDTATVMIDVSRSPDAGRDSLITTCGDILDLQSIHGGDLGGSYGILPSVGLNFSDPTAVDVNGLAPGLYEIFYEVTDPVCNTDIATIQLDILAFPNAGSGTVGNACTGVSDSTNLTTLLMPPFDIGGRWESFTDSGIQISSTSNVLMGNSTPGTYEFNYIVDLPICGSDTAIVMIDVLPSPDAGADNSIASCGGMIDIAALHGGIAGGTYEVSPSAVLDFSDPANVDVTLLSPGDYLVMYTVQDGTCPSDTSFITVTKERIPNAGVGSALAICEGSQDSLILNSLIIGTYDNDGTWMDMSGNGISVGANSEIDLTVLAGGSYLFRYLVSSPACGADSSDFRVDIISNPFAGRDTTDMICGGIVDLRAYFPGSNVGGTYTIAPAQNVDFSDPQAVDLASLSDGNYSIVYSINAPGCPAVSAELSLDIVSPPVAGLDTTLLRCDDPILTFDQVLRGQDPGGRIVQDKKQYAVGEMINLDTIADPTFLYIVDGNASCPADTAVLTLESDVFLSAGNNVNITDCDGQSIDLMDVLIGADPGGSFIDINNEVLPTTIVTIGAGNTAIFQYVTSTLCGVDSALITIDNIQYSNFSLAVSDGSPCQDDCIDISIDLTGPQSLQLYYSIEDAGGTKIDTSVALDGQVASIIQMCVVEGGALSSAVLAEDQEYILTVDSLIYNNQCSVPQDFPPVEIRSLGNRYGVLDTLVCVGESFTKGSILFNDNNPSDVVVMAGMASNFCDSILTVNVTFEDAIFGTLDTMICRGDEITINGRTYSENVTFGQDTFPGASSAGCDSILMVQVGVLDPVMGAFSTFICDPDSVLTIGDRSFTIDDASGLAVISGGASNGCDSLVDVSIAYLNDAMSSFDTIVCDAGFNFTLDGEVFSIDRSDGQVVYPGAAANGCDSIVNVRITYDLLDVSYDILPLLCPDDEEWGITLIGTDGSLPLSYEIAGQTGNVSSFPFIISLDIADDRIISFTDAMGCSRTDSIDLAIPGEILFEIEAVSIGSSSYQLSLNTDAVISIVEWNPGIGLSCVDCVDPIASINVDINYEVNVITSLGCELSDTITLRAETESLIFIPNVFSPNDDGFNDNWFITVPNNTDVTIKSLRIFDRWGNLVHEADQVIINSPQDGWNGTYASRKLNPGVYVYQVVYEDEEGNRQIITGDLTIIQ